ncbi:hypothetical protein [Brucella sp. 10RB9215]|uniref:hypothetical protein n=1 Tax=Brucella sp. 10RB9215 TaxID=1149953 RepID=UPI00155AA8FB|nr:hypothetical protein [Brucella sp. 10RB9215]
MLKRSQNAGAAAWSAVSRIFSGAGSTVDSGDQALPEKIRGRKRKFPAFVFVLRQAWKREIFSPVRVRDRPKFHKTFGK